MNKQKLKVSAVHTGIALTPPQDNCLFLFRHIFSALNALTFFVSDIAWRCSCLWNFLIRTPRKIIYSAKVPRKSASRN